jgi:hypothetical protein
MSTTTESNAARDIYWFSDVGAYGPAGTDHFWVMHGANNPAIQVNQRYDVAFHGSRLGSRDHIDMRVRKSGPTA